MANNTLKYKRLDPVMRDTLRKQWNKPVLWPIGMLLLAFILLLVPALIIYRRKQLARGLQGGG